MALTRLPPPPPRNFCGGLNDPVVVVLKPGPDTNAEPNLRLNGTALGIEDIPVRVRQSDGTIRQSTLRGARFTIQQPPPRQDVNVLRLTAVIVPPEGFCNLCEFVEQPDGTDKLEQMEEADDKITVDNPSRAYRVGICS